MGWSFSHFQGTSNPAETICPKSAGLFLLGPEMVKFCRNLCSCAVDQKWPFLNGNGLFLAHLPF